MHHPGFSCPLCRTFANLEEDVEIDGETGLDVDTAEEGSAGSGVDADVPSVAERRSSIRVDTDAVANAQRCWRPQPTRRQRTRRRWSVISCLIARGGQAGPCVIATPGEHHPRTTRNSKVYQGLPYGRRRRRHLRGRAWSPTERG